MPEPNPWIDLPRSRIHNRVLKPHRSVPITKMAPDPVKQYRRPKRSATCPERGFEAAMPIRYVVAIHERFERDLNDAEIGAKSVAIIVSSSSGKTNIV
jgi:hypothetical protein